MIQQFIDQYGYAAITVGTFLEGETIVILGGIAAHLGYLTFGTVLLCAFAGTLLGDQLYFYLGRRHGKRWLARHPGWTARVAKMHDVIERHRIPVMLTFRFFYGLRTITPFAIGTSRIAVWQFTLCNVISAAIWAFAFSGVGYLLGQAAARMLDDVRRYEHYLFVGVAACGGLVWLAYGCRTRLRHMLSWGKK